MDRLAHAHLPLPTATPLRDLVVPTMDRLGLVVFVAFTFLVGYELCLPVVPLDGSVSLPFFATRMNIPGAFGLSVKEALLILHALLSPAVLLGVIRRRTLPVMALVLPLFFVAEVVSAVVNAAPEDLPEAFRFLAMAYFVLAFQRHVSRHSLATLLVAVVSGLLASMLINLSLTFSSPAGRIGLLPVLYGQNGPGGFSGLFIGMSYPLYRLAAPGAGRPLIILTTAVALVVVIMSLSKLGMLMAGAGVVLWVVGTVSAARNRRRRALVLGAVTIVALGGGAAAMPEGVTEQARTIWALKFENSGEGFFDASDRTRVAYYLGTAEILARHPLGVSYTGIGRGLLETETFRRGLLKDEDSVREANPHNSFLYYIAANGVLGWIATVLAFSWTLVATWHACRRLASGGFAAFVLLALVYVLFANTLPSYFNEFAVLTLISILANGSRYQVHRWPTGPVTDGVVA